MLAHALLAALALAAPAKDDAAAKELEKLEGTWQLISAENDGKKMADKQAKNVRVTIKGGKHTVTFGEKPVAKDIAFTIDPTKTPKAVDDILPDGGMIRGIYELNGDTLRSCVAAPGKDRPKEFTGKAGSGQTLRVFKRVKS
jgi:uncharacterized protein (TIGR03067 family)